MTVPLQPGSAVPTAWPVAELVARRYTYGDCAVLALEGEVDVSCASAFRRLLLEAAADGHRRVVVDLAEVAFIDLVAVGELVQALGRSGWATGSIGLLAPSPFVRRVLELTRADSVFPIYDSMDEALGVPET